MLLLGGSKSHLSRVRSEAHVRWRWPPTPGSGLTALGKRSPSALSTMHLTGYILQSHAAGPLSPDTTPRACCRRQEWALPFRLQPCRPPCFSPSACCQRPPAPSLGTLAIPRIESWARSPNSAADGIKINLRVGLHPALLRCVLYSMPADFAAGLSAGSNQCSESSLNHRCSHRRPTCLSRPVCIHVASASDGDLLFQCRVAEWALETIETNGTESEWLQRRPAATNIAECSHLARSACAFAKLLSKN